MKKHFIFILMIPLWVLAAVFAAKYRNIFIQNEELKQTITLQESVLEAYKDDINTYLDKLSEYESLKMKVTKNGLEKKGNVYLIHDQSDMDLISDLIKRIEKLNREFWQQRLLIVCVNRLVCRTGFVLVQ